MPPAKKRQTRTSSSSAGRARPRSAEREAPDREEGAPHVSPFHPGFSSECMACPICIGFYALKNTKPEVMEHVMKAGFEMMQAFQALMQQYNERYEQAERLQKISIS